MKLRNLTIAGTIVVAFVLSGCGGTSEYPGSFSVANGDSSFYVGELFRHETVTVKCAEKHGTITATISESQTGNEFVTVQPDEGSGLAGGTLTTGDGEKFTWELRDGATADDEKPFNHDTQTGEPVSWTGAGILEFGSGMRQATTHGEMRVQIPGNVDCSGPA